VLMRVDRRLIEGGTCEVIFLCSERWGLKKSETKHTYVMSSTTKKRNALKCIGAGSSAGARGSADRATMMFKGDMLSLFYCRMTVI
jgi:hypothetical protein